MLSEHFEVVDFLKSELAPDQIGFEEFLDGLLAMKSGGIRDRAREADGDFGRLQIVIGLHDPLSNLDEVRRHRALAPFP